MDLTIRAPVYDESVEIEDGGYVEMREAIRTPTTPATVIVTPPPPLTALDEMTLPLAPPRLVRQRAVVLTAEEEAEYMTRVDMRFADAGPIRTLFGEEIPMGEALEPVIRPPGGFGIGFGFGPAPEILGWANGQPPFEPNDRNNPMNPNRFSPL